MAFNKQKIYLIFMALMVGLALVGCDTTGVDSAPTVICVPSVNVRDTVFFNPGDRLTE